MTENAPSSRTPVETPPRHPVLRAALWCAGIAAGAAAAAAAGALGWGLLVYSAALKAPAPPLLQNVPFSSMVADADGKLLFMAPAKDGIYRVRAPLEAMPAELVEATLLYEDRRFWEHPGVDAAALLRAGFMALLGERTSGASTITMQTVRLRDKLNTKTLEGKIEQIRRAIALEAHYAKKDILEAYFNLAPYGGNIEGAQAAALAYYRKNAADMSPDESVGLAVVPQNPVKRRPWKGEAFDSARVRLAYALKHSGRLSEDAAARLGGPVAVSDPQKMPFLAPHYTRLVQSRFPGAQIGTLRLSVQTRMESLIKDAVARLSPWGVKNAAIAVVDVRTMALLSLVGSADYFNDEIEGEVSAYTALRSPGSTLKPFVYALALEQGLIHSRSVLLDSPKAFGGYSPENADGRFRGPIDATSALIESRNLPALTLERKLHPDLYSFLGSAGMPLPKSREHYGLSLALGSGELTMENLVTLCAMLANDGLLRDIRLVQAQPAAPAKSLLSPEAAFAVRAMLAERGESITVAGSRIALIYKTGTSNGFRDAWTLGHVGPYVIGVWLGNFNARPNAYFQGASLAAPLWRQAAQALARTPELDWPERYDGKLFADTDEGKAARKDLKLSIVEVCRDTGDLANGLCPDLAKAWFIPGKSPTRDSGIWREILVDTATGMRACRFVPGKTERRAWAVWPPAYQAAFMAAGIVKRPPPPWMPGCRPPAEEAGAPVMLSPKPGVAYFTGTASKTSAAVTLEAAADKPDRMIYWFEGSRFLAASPARTPVEAVFSPGSRTITAVDDLGRSSTRTLRVKRP